MIHFEDKIDELIKELGEVHYCDHCELVILVKLEDPFKALDDKDEHVRELAVKIIVRMKDLGIADPLTSILKDYEYPLGQIKAEDILKRIRDPRSVEPLIAALKDKDEYVRAKAAKILGEIQNPRAVEPLTAALRDEAEDVRFEAGEALDKIKEGRQ